MEKVELAASPGDDDAGSRRRSMLAYFALTYGTAWALWGLAAVLTSPSMPLALRAQLFLPGTFAPGIVALWMTWRDGGRAGARALLGGLSISRAAVGAHWFVFAVSYMAAARLLAAGLHRLILGEWPAFGGVPWYLLLVATAFSMPFQVGEEIGWRGHALPRLTALVGQAPANLLLGGIWAAWHLPLFFIAGTDSTGQPFLPYLLAVIPLSTAIGWLYWRSGGSLLLTMLMHAAVNNTASIVPSRMAGATDPLALRATPMAWLTAAVLWAGAACLLAQMLRDRRDTTSRHPGDRFGG